MSNPITDLWLKMPPAFYRAFLARVAMLLVLFGSVALVWWSFNRLPPVEKKLQAQSDKLAHLEDEVMQMELKWNPREAEQVAAKFKQAQEELFTGNDEFIRWQEDLKRQTNQFVLEVKAQTGRTQDCPLPNKVFSVISTTIEVQPADEPSASPPYKRLLDFAQSLTTQKKRVDLMELSVNGNSNSVTKAQLGLQLWSQEPAARLP